MPFGDSSKCFLENLTQDIVDINHIHFAFLLFHRTTEKNLHFTFVDLVLQITYIDEEATSVSQGDISDVVVGAH